MVAQEGGGGRQGLRRALMTCDWRRNCWGIGGVDSVRGSRRDQPQGGRGGRKVNRRVEWSGSGSSGLIDGGSMQGG